jgi:hypothetical protein
MLLITKSHDIAALHLVLQPIARIFLRSGVTRKDAFGILKITSVDCHDGAEEGFRLFANCLLDNVDMVFAAVR